MKNFLVILAVILNLTSCLSQLKEKEMNVNNIELLKVALDTKKGINTRIQAIQQLDVTKKKNHTISELKKVLNRKKTEPEPDLIDFDPVAEERVIDLHIIGALNKLGDTTENNRIPDLVSQAIPFMREFGDERVEDANVIKSIQDPKLNAEIIALTKSSSPAIVENAVVVLNNLDLPHAPLGGELSSILPSKKITFTFSHLKEEMELYVKESQGKIELSGGVKEFIQTNNMQRGNVHLELSMVAIIQKVLPVLNFDYYIENGTVIICTHTEAAKRWQKWLDDHFNHKK